MSLSTDQLRELSLRIAEDPDVVEKLSVDELAQFRKYSNPYGSNFSAKKSFANITITNFREEWFQKYYLEAMVAFQYQLASECKPHVQIDEITDQFRPEINGLRDKLTALKQARRPYAEVEAELVRVEAIRDKKIEKCTRLYRACVYDFLNRNFHYDPTRHLRKARTENPADPERRPHTTAAEEAARAAKAAPAIGEKMRRDPELLYKYMRDNLLGTYQYGMALQTQVKGLMSAIATGVSVDDAAAIALRTYGELQKICTDMRRVSEPLAQSDLLESFKVSPPVDVHHHFRRYCENHHEQLCALVRDYYATKADTEFAIIYHRAFKTADAAREHRIQHENEFRAPVLTVENNGITLLGAYKQNSERVDFYNRNTEILKEMMEQNAQDAKLGQDMMTKKMKREKKRNIDECGPDAEGLSAFSKAGTITHDASRNITSIGAVRGMTREEQEKYMEEKSSGKSTTSGSSVSSPSDDPNDISNLMPVAEGTVVPGPGRPVHVPACDFSECPDDGIEVGMYFTTYDEAGNPTFKQSKFYTQAEAPLHGQEGSEFAEAYQPMRGDAEMEFETKTIRSRDGRTISVKVPLKE